ncbi:topoisomerase DNA-binding C4 zinc finger domain-containing protein [Pseudomonas sp. ME-P-057]|uniref:topoisomerase DNA-binding C4 zinc finger domain-containing protein n=1 Tax=Pseudomonas sp. ME-P-057 TaxID=3040321 RepID=UPI003306B313
MVSKDVLARGGGHGGRGGSRGGRGGRGGGSGGLWVVLLIAAGFGFFWLSSKLSRHRPTTAVNPAAGAPVLTRASSDLPQPQDLAPPEDWKALGRCPKCGGEMKTRTAKKGRYSGRAFFGCAAYPRCDGTRRKPIP